MISGKNQIIRQKKIECAINMPSVSLTFHDDNSLDHSDNNNFVKSNSEYSFGPSSNPDSTHTNEALSSLLTITSIEDQIDIDSTDPKQLSSNSSANLNPDQKKLTSETSRISLSSMLTNGSNFKISSALRARLRRSKSPSPQKNPLFSNNSLPSGTFAQKSSHKLTSYFSKSCQEEASVELKEAKEFQTPKNATSNGSSLSLNTTRLKSFLAFSHSSQKSSSSLPKKSSYDENPTSPGYSKQNSIGSNRSSPVYSKQNSIGSYEVDLEKLARELSLPSMNQPLTSFKRDQPKPVLQTQKTLDTSSNNNNSKKKPITRADTNKN